MLVVGLVAGGFVPFVFIQESDAETLNIDYIRFAVPDNVRPQVLVEPEAVGPLCRRTSWPVVLDRHLAETKVLPEEARDDAHERGRGKRAHEDTVDST